MEWDNLSYTDQCMGGFFMRKVRFRDRSPFLPLFLSGFVAGVLYLAFFGKTAVYETSLMSSYFFSKYSYVEFVKEELFLYILKSRLSTFTILWLTGLTVLGTLAVYLYLFWIGAALGITVTTAAMKMGMKGIGFCIASSLPQVILYVPAVCWILKKICEMSEGREWTMRQWSNGKRRFYSYLAVWLLGTLLFLAGAFLESYVNPLFLKTFLKKI